MNNINLNEIWLAESIRLTELQAGPLDDSAANRRARASGGDIQHKIIIRALALSQRDGLLTAQQQWLHGACIAATILIVLALLLGTSLPLAALGDGSRPVNIFWALSSLLGLHLFMLLLWLISLLLPASNSSLLGRLGLWLADKLSRTGRALQLAPALLMVLNRQRATRWGVGILLHGLWLLILSSALMVLLLLLSTRHYQFLWETTLLSSDSFITLTQALAVLPDWLGFPQPDLLTIKASGNQVVNSEPASYQWAGWLVGVFVVYGVLPRALLLLISLAGWRYRLRHLAPDMHLLENQLLADRLQPASEQLGVTDTDTGEGRDPILAHASAMGIPHGRLLLAIELDQAQHWPPTLDPAAHYGGMINDRQQRQQVLEQLQANPVNRLLIACDPRRSPDRGTLRLMTELASLAANCRIWLIDEHTAETKRLAYWREALQQLHLEQGNLHWLEENDE